MKKINDFFVLLVDDNTAEGTLARLAIKSVIPTATIKYVESGADAIAWLQQLDHPMGFPDLMILDLNMPMVDGIEVLKLLKAFKLKSFPVYMLSGSSYLGEERLSLKCGADAFYEKRRDFEETVELFTEILPAFLVERFAETRISA